MTITVDHLESERFSPVVDAFARTVEGESQTGAALSIWQHGRPIVEVRGGYADRSAGRPWEPTTLSVVFSSTKGLASIAIGMLHERGALPSLDVPLADVWPEFAAAGKDRVSIADALAHRAGVSAPRRDITLDQLLDGHSLAEAIAEQEPLWTPGSSHQYHAVTFGTIAEQIVLRVTGRSIGGFVAEEIAGPLDADVWIGLPAAEEGRVARLEPAPAVDSAPVLESEARWLERAVTLGGALPADLLGTGEGGFNDPRLHEAEIAGAGGIASATGLARIWSATVVETLGVRLLNADTVQSFRRSRSAGAPFFASVQPPLQAWGTGFMITSDWDPYLSADSFGHDGAGGQVAFADPETEIGFAYLTNRMGDMERGQSVTRALADALA